MEPAQDRRKNTRFSCDLDCVVVTEGQMGVQTHCVDISRGGICVAGALYLANTTDVLFKVRAVWQGAETDELELPGTVVWCGRTGGDAPEYQIGARFYDSVEDSTKRRLDVLLQLLAGELDTTGR